jgi:hypothetical protein
LFFRLNPKSITDRLTCRIHQIRLARLSRS